MGEGHIDEMISAYIKLYNKGYAHSVECWKDDKLAGGLYGLSIGGCFFGESMFTYISDASKVALIVLSDYLLKLNFDLIDCQVKSKHLMTMGGVEVSRHNFLIQLKNSLKKPTINRKWIY